MGGGHIDFPAELALFYLSMPSGRNGAPANFAIFGDAAPAIHSHCGMARPGWYRPFPFLSRLHVGDGMFFDLKTQSRLGTNTSTWARIAKGLFGKESINGDKMRIEGKCGPRHTLIGCDIDSGNWTVRLPVWEISGIRLLFGGLYGSPYKGIGSPGPSESSVANRTYQSARRHFQILYMPR